MITKLTCSCSVSSNPSGSSVQLVSKFWDSEGVRWCRAFIPTTIDPECRTDDWSGRVLLTTNPGITPLTPYTPSLCLLSLLGSLVAQGAITSLLPGHSATQQRQSSEAMGNYFHRSIASIFTLCDSHLAFFPFAPIVFHLIKFIRQI